MNINHPVQGRIDMYRIFSSVRCRRVQIKRNLSTVKLSIWFRFAEVEWNPKDYILRNWTKYRLYFCAALLLRCERWWKCETTDSMISTQKTFMLMHIQMNSSNWRRLLCTIDTLMCHWMKTMHHTSKLNLQTFPFSQYACCVCGGFWLHQSANWISCLTNDSWNKLLTLFDINIHGIQIRFIYVVFRKSHFHCTFSFSHHCIHRTVIWALNDFTALKTLGLVSGHVINFFSLRSCFDVGYIETAFY